MSSSGRSPYLPFNVLSYGAKGDGVTDDTTAIQGAISAASASAGNGIREVWAPPGYGFLHGQITPMSGVVMRCYGATMIPNFSGITRPGWYMPNTATAILQRFSIRGGYWQGDGLTNKVLVIPGFAGAGMSGCVFREMYVNNWASNVVYLRAAQSCACINNNVVGNRSTGNALGVAFAHTDPQLSQYNQFLGNNVTDCQAAGIAIVMTDASTAPAGYGMFTVISDNVVTCDAAVGNGLTIDVENSFNISGGGPWNEIVIANNVVNNIAPSSVSAYGVTTENGFESLVQGNTIIVTNGQATSYGICAINGGQIVARDNRVTVSGTSKEIGVLNSGQVDQVGNRFSTGMSQGRAVLVAGTVTVATTEIRTGDNVLLTVVSPAGTRGEVQVGTIVSGTSFVINSIQPGTVSTIQSADTSTVFWQIIH